MTSALRFLLLGPFEAYRGDDRVPPSAWRTRQALTVLKLLLGERDSAIPFARLADTAWPESDPADARNSLQVAVGTLRRMLEPELRHGSGSTFIRTEGEHYRFVAAGSTVDVDEFLRARQVGLAADRAGRSDEALRLYQDAIGLYRGDYLADDPYAEWTLAPRERLREAYLGTIRRLAALLADRGRSEEAIALAERGLVTDPLREELYRDLIRFHGLAGRHSHARAAYDRCAKMLRAELGTEPRPETRALLGRPHMVAPAGVPEETTAPPLSGELHVPFVGRAAELELFRRGWARAESDAGLLLLIDGVAGVGKTRLARHFADPLGPQTRVVWMAAHETDTGLSFAPLLRLVASWLDRGATVAQLQRLGPHAPVLAHVLPKVRGVWPGCPPLAVDPPETGHVLEALTQALLVIAGSGRALLVLDDAHWADDDTHRWLAYALRRWPAGLLVVATRRSGERDTAGFDTLLAGLRDEARLVELPLGPLSRTELDRLVSATASAADRTAATRLAAELFTSTQGNPLFVVEMLREMRNRGGLIDDGAGRTRIAPSFGADVDLPVPAGARDVIAARVRHLDDGSRRVLTAVAVIGVPCSADLIESVLERPRDRVLDELETLLQRHLLRISDDGQRYVVDHPLVGRAVYDDLSPGRRHDLHRRVASALAPSRATDPTAGLQVLRHLVAGDADAETIVAAAEAAGDESLRRHAYAEAVECFVVARDRLSRIAREPGDGIARRAIALERLGDALTGAGRWDEAEERFRELIDATDDALVRSRIRRKLARMLGDVPARFAEALELLDAAARDLPGRGGLDVDLELGRVEAARSLAHFLRSEFSAVIEDGDRALALWADRPDAARDSIDLLQRMGGAEQRLGQLDMAERRFRRALARARLIGDRLLEARSQETLNLVLLQRGDLTQAHALMTQALRTYRELGVPKFEGQGLINMGWLLSHMGDLAAARAAYEDALRRSEALEARYTAMHALVGLGEVLLRAGDHAAARRTLERGLALAEAIGNRQRRAHALVYLGAVALAEGDADRARSDARRGIEEGHAIGDSYSLREGHTVLSRALLALGDPTAAEAAARRGIEVSRAGGFAITEARSAEALAEALWALGQRDAVASELDRAEASFRRYGARYDLAVALHARATTVLASSDRRAARVLAEALALAMETGAAGLAERVRDATARLGRTFTSSPRPGAPSRVRRPAADRRHD